MALRKRNSPGIEINEIDRSQYDKQTDYSLPNAPVCLVVGFADKGENYKTQWINSKNTFLEKYGIPTNIAEKYFYNASTEILNRGGVLLTHKLPYYNSSKDKLTYIQFDLSEKNVIDKEYIEINNLDNTLSTYIDISLKNTTTNTISLETYDNFLTKTNLASNRNTITIVNITNNKYDKINSFDSEGSLGIIPIIVSPANALYYQNLLSNITNANFQQYNIIEEISSLQKDISFSDKMLNTLSSIEPLNQNGLNDNSWSKEFSKYFPLINFTDENKIDTTNLKKIGIIVTQAFIDKSSNKINLEILESFVGSLDVNSKNQTTNSTDFIDNIVNTQSQFINVFTNCNKSMIENTNFIAIKNQHAISMGFTKTETVKKINYKESIISPLNKMFGVLNNITTSNIDIIIDAGLTNIAQYLANENDIDDIDNIQFSVLNDRPTKWFNVAKILDEFCKYTRKDCIFLLDAPHSFCLDNDQKIVRPSNPSNTINNSIIPKLKFLTGLNSSYTAGYCDWFYCKDEYTGDFFWCPPSIKAAGIYCYTDIYFHTWDAPAGMNRGQVLNAYDTAFSPNDDEAGKIYQQCWNYSINYPLNGIILEGQKTFQINKTALDRINVRRLMIHLEKQTKNIAKYFLYEGNTPYLRQKFVDTITPIFENAKNGNGIIDYIIKCDETNNTPTTIERNEMHCTIAVKPVKTVEWIICNFIVTNQSANIQEEIKKI